MKKKKSNKKSIIFYILIIFTITSYLFKNQIYNFIIKFDYTEKLIYKFNIDEFMHKSLSRIGKEHLNFTNRVNDKIILESFAFSKKNKERSAEFEKFFNKRVDLKLEENDSKISKISLPLADDKKIRLFQDVIILSFGESISCDCLDIIKDKTLILENKGAAADRSDTPQLLTISIDKTEVQKLMIKNNEKLYFKVSKDLEGKSISINWNKNASGLLIFYGFMLEQKPEDRKTIFLTANEVTNSDYFENIANFDKDKKVFITTQSIPIYDQYHKNIKALESHSLPVNNGYTYGAEDLFLEREKFLTNTINSYSKDFLRINIFSNKFKNKQIKSGNSLIEIQRELTGTSLYQYLQDIINTAASHFVRIDIQSSALYDSSFSKKLIKNLIQNNNIISIISNDFNIKREIKNISKPMLISLKDEDNNEIITELKDKFTLKEIPQIMAIDTILKMYKSERKKPIFEEREKSIIQSQNEEIYIFDDGKYYSQEKFSIPLSEEKKYFTEIHDNQEKYQIRDIIFSMQDVSNGKVKIISKDKIIRCFSNSTLKSSNIQFDKKLNSYVAELKLEQENVLNEWILGCLIHSDSFINDYKFEALKNGKSFSANQVGLGQYGLHPNSSIISNNYLIFNNAVDFSLLKSLSSPREVYGDKKNELVIWSHYYPSKLNSLNNIASYEDKK